MDTKQILLQKLCNYIIENKITLNDDDEDEFGQVVATIYLENVLKDTEIQVKSLTVDDLSVLSLHEFPVFKDNNKNSKYYGMIFDSTIEIGGSTVYISISDGY